MTVNKESIIKGAQHSIIIHEVLVAMGFFSAGVQDVTLKGESQRLASHNTCLAVYIINSPVSGPLGVNFQQKPLLNSLYTSREPFWENPSNFSHLPHPLAASAIFRKALR